MTCEELKNNILNNTLTFKYLIFKYSDNPFLCDEYINEYARLNHSDIVYLASIENAPKVDIFNSIDTKLYVLHTEEFNNIITDDYYNLIVVCSKTALKDNVIDFPKLVDWQVIDFIKSVCRGLGDNASRWLYDTCKGNIYRISNELDKLKVFPIESQEEVLKLFIDEGNFKDLNPLNIFDFINAIIKKDKKVMTQVLSNLDVIDIEGTGVVTLLLNNIKNMINVQLDPKATAESLGLKENQFKAIKWRVNSKVFTNEQLVNIYEFLTSFDYKLKSGNLQLSANDILVGYLICNLFTL